MKDAFLSVMLTAWVCGVASAWAGVNVRDLGVSGNGDSDQTEVLQKILDGKDTDFYFPAGIYRLGTILLKGGCRLEFAPGAIWKIEESRIVRKRLIDLKGNGICIEGLAVDFLKNKTDEITFNELEAVMAGTGLADLRFTGLRLERNSHYETEDPRDRERFTQTSPLGIFLENCRDVEVSRCAVKNLFSLLAAKGCANVNVHENRMQGGRYMTDFYDGSQSLHHSHNWSSGTLDQVRWWGGDANDRKPDTLDSRADIVQRGVAPGDTKYDPNEIGVYEILIEGNYAEYGRTLGWGSRGRQIIFNANTARYMSDMAYDSEGGENVIFSNNISINSKTAGIGCYFWSEKVVISGNQILVENHGDPKYQGEFIRLQSLNSHPQGKTGAGQAVITGNLFSSDIDKETKRLSIEASRDLMIVGNKFHNGSIVTKELACGPLSIKDNDFTTSIETTTPAILMREGVTEAVLSGNTIRGNFSGGKIAGAAAIQLFSRPGQRKILEGNQVFGWKEALRIGSMAKKPAGAEKPCRYLIRNNLLEGTMDLGGRGDSDLLVFEENRNPETLQLISGPVPPGKIGGK